MALGEKLAGSEGAQLLESLVHVGEDDVGGLLGVFVRGPLAFGQHGIDNTELERIASAHAHDLGSLGCTRPILPQNRGEALG